MERFSKLKYNRNGKEPVTHKTVNETKVIFETEISLYRTPPNCTAFDRHELTHGVSVRNKNN